MRKLEVALVLLMGVGSIQAARAEFNCMLYAASKPSAGQISSDATLNAWLTERNAPDPNGPFILIGSFVDNGGKLEFQYKSSGSDQNNSSPQNRVFGIPVPAKASGGCDTPSMIDYASAYSCYDGGTWKDSLFWTKNAKLPHDMPNKTQVYSLSASLKGPESSKPSALLFGGSDCDKLVMKDSWNMGSNSLTCANNAAACKTNPLKDFYSDLMNRNLGPAAVNDSSPAASSFDAARPTTDTQQGQQMLKETQSGNQSQ